MLGVSTHNLVSERLELATPVQVQNEAINDALDVQIAEGKICVLRRGGVVSCWGDDNFALDDMIAGQIGAFRTPEAVSFPAPIGDRPIIHSFAAGPDFAVVARGVDGGQMRSGAGKVSQRRWSIRAGCRSCPMTQPSPSRARARPAPQRIEACGAPVG